MKKINAIVKSEDETLILGEKISQYLSKGDILGLNGDLGSGKTTFVRGILRGLNYEGHVTSPTFTLINEYDADLYVIHVDFYREENINRWKNIGFEETMYNSDLVIIEWSNLIPEILPADIKILQFDHIGINERKIYLK